MEKVLNVLKGLSHGDKLIYNLIVSRYILKFSHFLYVFYVVLLRDNLISSLEPHSPTPKGSSNISGRILAENY